MPVISTRATGRILASYRSRVPRSLITPLAAFAVASAWSGSWITGKLGVTGAPPLELSAVRFVIAAIAVAAIAIATRTSIDLGGMGPIALRERSPLAVVTLAMPIGAALLLPLGLIEHGYRDVASWSTSVWLDILYLALIASVASFTAFYWIVRRVGAGIASLTSYFVPVLTLIMAVVFLGDRPEPLQLAGGLVILAGVRVATLRPAGAATVPEGSA